MSRDTVQRKILAEENFGKFGDLLRICQSFIHHLLVISEKAIEAGVKFAKVFFAKCTLACNSPKFSPTKIFHYVPMPFNANKGFVPPLALSELVILWIRK